MTAPPIDDPALTLATRMVDGASYVLDQPPGVPAVWGTDTRVLWAEGEALMIAGPQGVGKTTLIGQILRGLLGVGDELVLGLPIAPTTRVLYLAMDRPRQISRSLGRAFGEEHRNLLTDRLVVWKGPPPGDIAANTGLLLALAEDALAEVVIVDSIKDAALGLSKDEVGAAYNRARQLLLNSGRQLLEAHHITKRRTDDTPVSIGDVYGSTWLTSGAGSVILLGGDPGDPIVSFRHLKQPADEIGPYRLLHDQDTGRMSIEHAADLVALVRRGGVNGVTAKMAASTLTEKLSPTRTEIEKARRRLDRLVVDGVLFRREGEKGGQVETRRPTAWFMAERQSRGNHGNRVSAGQDNHGLFGPDGNHNPITAITSEAETAGQDNHGGNHGNHAGLNHDPPSPYEGEGPGGSEGVSDV